MNTILHALLLAIWPGCFVWFLLLAWWDERRHRADYQQSEDFMFDAWEMS